MTVQRSLKQNLESIQKTARERTVKTQDVEYDLETLVARIRKKTIKLDPEYQRRHRWPAETSSRLIESLILNIPIPVVFLSQDVDVDDETEGNSSRYTVIDGQQRLTAIFEFWNNEFPLEGLETLQDLNGSYYRDLPPFLIRRLEERTIRCLRIDSTVDEQVKFDIFERLNTGSVKLESQELRNATVRGPFNDTIKHLAEFEPFRRLIQVDVSNPSSSPKVRKMEDVELVLRFFALKDKRYLGLRSGFRDFLTSSLAEFNELDQAEIDGKVVVFLNYMSFIYDNVGPAAFSKWRIEGGIEKRMSSFNAAVFDAVAVGLAEAFSPDVLVKSPERVQSALAGYRTLFADDTFFASVNGSVNDAAKVKFRIEAMKHYLLR
ncbi:DUF262 domain-containing protein [Sphingomonas sp. RHCKR47]|uniref:DUF262 domain-containing protein n=1 Tax=Sphingomonas citricola TaxID=2862498 RepID=UPI001C674BC0|nr:DUF262 domain-containing protein [Sphingomonas citricola]MBW6524807.1 DUF262 domain-containing protein [Sphingomonas citricola]